jgi:hypothetical protein
MRFEHGDVVRHPLVQSIIQAYDRAGLGGRSENVQPPSGPKGSTSNPAPKEASSEDAGGNSA